MPQTIKNHKITITIGTVCICVLMVFSFAFNLGAEQNQIKSAVQHNSNSLQYHLVDCEKKEEKEENFRKEIRDAIVTIKEDIATIKGKIKKD